MLSPHEFATLMLIKHSPDQIDLSRAELGTLLERQLIVLHDQACGGRSPQLTRVGQSILDACSRVRFSAS